MIEKAIKIYKKRLWDSPEVLNYLIKERGLTEQTLDKYDIGYSPGTLLVNSFKDIDDRLLSTNGDYDYFDQYITFPSYGPNGIETIYGRAFPDKDPSHKLLRGEAKKGLYNSAALKKSSVILVESPIDSLTLNQAGFNSVASFGVGLSVDSKLKFKDIIVYIFFDSDEAGQIGAESAAGKLLGVAKRVYILKFPGTQIEKLDINSYFLKVPHASDRIRYLIEQAEVVKIKSIKKIKFKKMDEDKIKIEEVGIKLFPNVVKRFDGLWVRCPFHKNGMEIKPSLRIGGKSNIFYCYACNKIGGPVKLVELKKKVSTDEAVSWIKENFQKNF